MKILGINSSDKLAEIILINDDEKKSVKIDSPHSENLMLGLEKLLNENNLEVRDFDAFSCVVGPGSFTGIRIAVAMIKGMAMVNKTAKIISINNFELLSHNVSASNFLTVLDSSNIDAYIAKFINRKCEEITYISHDKLNDYASSVKLDVYALNGQKDKLSIDNLNFVDLSENTLINLTLEKYNANDFVNLNDLKPLYVKLSQAERTRSEKILSELKIEQVKDVTEVYNIEKECFKDEAWSEETFTSELLLANKYYFVAKYDGINIGFIGFETASDEANIQKVAVLLDYQNCSVGTKLVEYALNEIKNLAIEKVFLEVDEQNREAISLYKKFGFKEYSKRENYYKNGHACLLMKKD